MSFNSLKAKIEQLCEKVLTLNSKVTNINNAFKEKGVDISGVVDPDYSQTIDGIIDKTFGDCFKQKVDFTRLFAGATTNHLPNFPTNNGTTFTGFSQNCINIIDYPQYDYGSANVVTSLCAGCTNLKTFPLLLVPNATGWAAVWNGCSSLETIGGINMSSAAAASSLFFGCGALKEISRIDGVIPISISLSSSPLINAETRQRIVNALKDLTGSSSQTIYFHTDVAGQLTPEESAIILARNWNVG